MSVASSRVGPHLTKDQVRASPRSTQTVLSMGAWGLRQLEVFLALPARRSRTANPCLMKRGHELASVC